MEEPTECNRQEDNNFVFLPWNWGAGGSNTDRLAARSEDEPYCILTVLLDGQRLDYYMCGACF